MFESVLLASLVVVVAPAGDATVAPNRPALITASAATGAASVGSLVGLGFYLSRLRPQSLEFAESRLGSQTTLNGCLNWIDGGSCVRRDFAGWPLLLTASAGGFGLGTGLLVGRFQPLRTQRARTIALAAGTSVLITGAALWLAGRLRNVGASCVSKVEVGSVDPLSRCYGAWFDTSAALLGTGAGMFTAGMFALGWSEASGLRPSVSVSRSSTVFSLSGRF